MMEPKQKLLRTGVQVRKPIADRRMVLAQSVTPGSRAIKSDSAIVGAVEVNRIPVGARLRVPPRRWAIMMSAPHQVVQAQGRHIVNQRVM